MIAVPRTIRRAAVSASISRPAQVIFRRVQALQFITSRPTPLLDPLAYRWAMHQPLTSHQRRASVAATERLFMTLTECLRPDAFIEAGAKDAGIAARIKAMWPQARAVAFEANPFTYERFADQHAAGSGVEYLNVALSSAPGTVTFLPRSSRNGQPIADGKGSLLERVALKQQDRYEVTVPSTSLDAYFSDRRGKQFALWIDVEGAAGLVLAGGANVLRNTSHLIVEVEECPFWDGQALRGDIVESLRAHGFTPVARDFQSRFQFNLVFVRRDLLGDRGVKTTLNETRSILIPTRRPIKR